MRHMHGDAICQEHGFCTIFQHFSLTHNPYLFIVLSQSFEPTTFFHPIPTAHSLRKSTENKGACDIGRKRGLVQTDKQDDSTTMDSPFHIPR